MIAGWASVEADFRREYSIDLLTELTALSWRTFLILVRGLSPNSATVTKIVNAKMIGQGTKAVTTVKSTAAQSTFEGLFGRAPKS